MFEGGSTATKEIYKTLICTYLNYRVCTNRMLDVFSCDQSIIIGSLCPIETQIMYVLYIINAGRYEVVVEHFLRQCSDFLIVSTTLIPRFVRIRNLKQQ